MRGEIVLPKLLSRGGYFGTCKCISQLFKWNAAVFPAVKKDWHQTERHILHKNEKEEERLRNRRRFQSCTFVESAHLGETSCMGRWLTAWERHSSRRFLDGNDPDKDEAARKDVDEGDELGEEAVLHVARSLKVPFEDGHKDKMNCKNCRDL